MTLVRKTVGMPGGRTSFKLEDEYWQALNEAAAERDLTRSAMITLITANRTGNVASMLRVWCLQEARARADGLAADLATATTERAQPARQALAVRIHD